MTLHERAVVAVGGLAVLLLSGLGLRWFPPSHQSAVVLLSYCIGTWVGTWLGVKGEVR